MMTDRFIRVPIRLILAKLSDMNIDDRGEDSFMMINKMDISRYYPVSDDTDEKTCTKVIFKGDPEGTIVYLEVREFEKLLNDHDK